MDAHAQSAAGVTETQQQQHPENTNDSVIYDTPVAVTVMPSPGDAAVAVYQISSYVLRSMSEPSSQLPTWLDACLSGLRFPDGVRTLLRAVNSAAFLAATAHASNCTAQEELAGLEAELRGLDNSRENRERILRDARRVIAAIPASVKGPLMPTTCSR